MENMILGAILAVSFWSYFKDIKPTLVITCSIPLSVVLRSFDVFYRNVVKYHFHCPVLRLGVSMLVDNSIIVI